MRRKSQPPPNFPKEEPTDYENVEKEMVEAKKKYVRIFDREWTKKERELLTKYYKSIPTHELAKHLQRSVCSVEHQVDRLGLRVHGSRVRFSKVRREV